jgi:hypothetical protein
MRILGVILFVVGVIGQLAPALTSQGDAFYLPSAVVLWIGAALVIAAERNAAPTDQPPLEPETPTRTLFRRICLVGAPAVLVAIEIFHPADFTDEVYSFLSQPQAGYFGPEWWLTLHMIQTPMVGLVSAGLWLLVAGQNGLWPWVTRVAAVVFVVYYTVLDAIGGVFIGWLLSSPLNAATAATRAGVEATVTRLWTDPLIGGVGSVVSQTGSWAILVAAVAAALALARYRAPLWPLVVLAAAGTLVQISHARPYGPVGFGLLLVAAIGLDRWRVARSAVAPVAAPLPTS